MLHTHTHTHALAYAHNTFLQHTVPVGFDLDGENKAKALVMWKLQSPHVRAFHVRSFSKTSTCNIMKSNRNETVCWIVLMVEKAN